MAAILPRGIWVNRCTSIADDQVHTYHIISTWPIHTDPVLIWSPWIDSAVEGQLQNTQPYVPCHNSSLPGQRWQQLWWRHQMETFSALPGQGATPVRGAPGWLALNPVGGMREPPSGSMQLQELQFQSVIYGNPTLELTSEFSHAHLTIFSTVWDVGWFYQDHASRVNAKLQKIYQYFVG